MNGGKSPECRLHAKEGEGKLAPQPLPWAAEESPSSSSSSGVQLAEAPILVLTYFHEAFRQEIGELHRCVMKLAAAGSGGRECLWELRERFELLKLAYGYHRAAEDEVLLVALDSHVKYVACTYSLEHRSLDELFDSTIQFFDLLMEDDEKGAKPFQELLFSIGTVHSFTCKHMLKEEKQVFPLLRQQFSLQEQALLVWQFLGSIPIKLLEDFYSRMASFIPAKEQEDIIDCVKCMVIPKESPLHEVITDWLRKNGRENVGQQKETSATIANFTLIEGFRIWHAAISRDLVATLDDLYLMESSGSFSNLSSVIFQLKFLLDVLIFYRNALDHIYYPQIDGLADGCEAPLFNWSCNESQIRNLQQFLNYDTHDALLKCNFIEPLLHRLKSFIEEISIFFTHQEIEVFDKISENCSPEMQRQLLYMSIHILPLGWLERVVLWFSDHFSAPNHKQGNYLADDCSTLPPLEQFYTGCSHKTSMDMIGCDPQDFFKSRFFSLSEQFGGDAECSPSTSQSDTRNNTMSTLNKPHCGRTALTAFLSLRQQASHKFSKLAAEKNDLISDMNSWDPFQIIFCFHKALKKDLENLLCISVRVTDNTAFFEDFQKRIVLIRSLYQAHSDMEDEVAFPALEEKGKVHNICHSYTVDHRLEAEHFDSIFVILEKISELSLSSLNSDLSMIQRHHQLGLKLQDTCRSFQRILTDHVQNEEVEVWSSLKECLSIEEQEKIIGGMLGRIRAEVLQDMIPWLMDSLTLEEQHMFMSSWRQIARNTMFGEWLSEWWEGNDVENAVELDISPLETEDPLEVISTYLAKDILKEHKEIICDRGIRLPRDNPIILDSEESTAGVVDKGKNSSGFKSNLEDFDRTKLMKDDKQAGKNLLGSQKSKDQKHVVSTSQEELEAAIRRVSRDSSLDPHKKSCILQNLLMSRWIVAHQQSNSDVTVQSNEEQIWGCSPSYRDLVKMIYGCKHYKRNCKLLTPCCNQLYPCRHCHDEETDHSVDRKLITKMMCMKCLIIQPIGPTCLTESCNNLVMARYYCRICKIYDDERDIYHCPYCNLCRVGKGLGIDYFHCMTCNACMSRSLSVHVCRQKCLEDNCPICHEFMFTSSSPTKALPCGHLMHSACFKDYTCTHYTCPICSKSLGDMQGYFQTLDTMLAEEEVPDEYSDKAQAILCNDCEKRGSSPFHWRYHKCPHCGSYNTRLL